jgi:NAD-dependent dihydropyrimidine dehydrogenase PreA subunit
MSFKHVYFNEKVCDGCEKCVEVCMCDAFVRNPKKGKPPILLYPDECWFCGSCVSHCPHKDEGAIQIVTPFQMRGSFKRSRALAQ